MTILVTGASGFLGSTICRTLFEAGMDFRPYVRPGSSHPTLDSLPVKRYQGDINDVTSLRMAMTGCSGVVHTAMLGRYGSRHRNDLHRVNVQGTRCVMDACVQTGVERITILDTISGFPASRYPTVRVPDFVCDLEAQLSYPYLHSKMQAMAVVERYRDRLRICAAYCAPMYGAGDKHGHTGVLFKLLNSGLRIAPPGGASVVCVDDAAVACILATTHSDAPDRMVISSEHCSFLKIYNEILESFESSRRIGSTIPAWLYGPTMAIAAVTDRLGCGFKFSPYLVRNGFRFRYFESSKTQTALGWKPQTSIAGAIRMQTAWMRTYGRISTAPVRK